MRVGELFEYCLLLLLLLIVLGVCLSIFFFFFQAEDGIRDTSVTGVQTCALPISSHHRCGDEGSHPAHTQSAEEQEKDTDQDCEGGSERIEVCRALYRDGAHSQRDRKSVV